MNAGLYLGLALVTIGVLGKMYYALRRLGDLLDAPTRELVESRYTLSWSDDPEVRELEQITYYDEIYYGPDSEGNQHVPSL